MQLIPAHLIQKKRDGGELSTEEIFHFIQGVDSGAFTDYQASALLMAIFFQGMTLAETVALTEAMLRSGERYDFSSVPGPKVDKHSTGGVGDKVSLILAPLAAACGLKVPMMSGRGLGHTGGTLDKLEAIRGFQVHLPRERVERQLREIGCVMIGQSQSMVPADKKLYAIRDVTATVECIPLIVASILSKKLAEGTEALVLDVKVGSGAFMKSKPSAKALATLLVRVGKKLGMKCRALLTHMDQPLGYAVGHSVEVLEAIQVLRNEKNGTEFSSADLRELTLQLCANMLVLGGVCRTLADGRKLAACRLTDGSAWGLFCQMVLAQGGDVAQVEDPSRLPVSSQTHVVKSQRKGYIHRIDTEAVGRVLIEMGGGRRKATDAIDPSVGLLFHRKLGSKVSEGDPLVTLLLPRDAAPQEWDQSLRGAIDIGGTRKAVQKLILDPGIF